MSGLQERFPELGLMLQAALIVLVFLAVRKLTFVGFHDVFTGDYPRDASWLTTSLDAAPDGRDVLPFSSFSIFFGALKTPLFVVLFATHSGLIASRWTALSWHRLENGSVLRPFLVFVAVLLAWKHATYGYNYLWDQSYLLDRALLAGGAALIWLHPLFVALFLGVLFPVMAQVNYPFSTQVFGEEKVLFDLLILFVAFLLTRTFRRGLATIAALLVVYTDLMLFLPSGAFEPGVWIPCAVALLALTWVWQKSGAEPDARAFLLVAVCLLAANYWWPGLKKLLIGPHLYEWVWLNEPANQLAYRFSQGWMGFASPETRESLMAWVRDWGTAISIATVALELAAVAILWNRTLTRAFLAGFVTLHVCVLAVFGVLFWEWIAVDFGLFVLTTTPAFNRLYQRRVFALSAVLILLSPIFLSPPSLAWFDTRLSHRIELEGVGESGAVYGIAPETMNPYHRAYQADQYLFLVMGKTLEFAPRTFDAAEKINAAGVDGISHLIATDGRVRFDPEKWETYNSLVRRWFLNMNRDPGAGSISRLAPPTKMTNSKPQNAYRGQEPLSVVRTIFVQQYLGENGLEEVERRTVSQVKVE